MKPTTLITGAGIRIGAILAEHLAAQGHDLVLHYRRSQAEAEALATRLRATPQAPHITLVQADLEALDPVAFWRGLPPVTNIIHNASRYVRDRLESFTPADLRAHIAIHLEAPLLLTQGFLAQLPKGTNGSVIVIGDGEPGWIISPEFFTYGLSKYLWNSAIDLLAAACAPRVRANVVALGPTLPSANEEGLFVRLAENAPLGRTGTPEEVCRTIDFLFSSPGITGQVISLANGLGLITKRP
jgi:NAD(P)-dependent dehydrogenase (short-subunit alcohol dehydrogenase family)